MYHDVIPSRYQPKLALLATRYHTLAVTATVVGVTAGVVGIGATAYNLAGGAGGPNVPQGVGTNYSATEEYLVQQDQAWVNANKGINSGGAAERARFGTLYDPGYLSTDASNLNPTPNVLLPGAGAANAPAVTAPATAPASAVSSILTAPNDLEYIAFGLAILAAGAFIFAKHKK